jgi:membrane-associated protease RseP (regulator of RpoE activity)
MRVASVVLVALVWSVALASQATAQPILNRVEQFLRDQLGEAPAPIPPDAKGVEPGYLGVTADDRPEGGVLIVNVTAASPAAQAGLLAGDVIVAIDGQPVRTMDDMAQRMAGKGAGARLAFTINRGGVEQRPEVTLGRRAQSRVVGAPGAPAAELPAPPGPSSATPAPPGPRLGIRTLAVSEEVRLQNNLPDGRGATVIAVTAGSPAERAGIPLGAVITAVDDRPVDSPQSLARAIAASGGAVELTYFNAGLQNRRRVDLGAVAVAPPPGVAQEPALELRGRPVASPPAPPQPTPGPTLAVPPQQSLVEQLEARIKLLEERIEKLEARLPSEPEAKP